MVKNGGMGITMVLLSNNRIIEPSRNVADKIAAGEVVNRPYP